MSRDYNLFEMWKDLYDQSSSYVDDKVKEDFPSQGIGQILEMNLLFKKFLNETTEQYLEQVNVPTRNDIANLSSLIVNVDAKVDSLEELLEDSRDQAGQPELQKEVANLKKEMKNLDTKLNQILDLLKETKEATATAATNEKTSAKAAEKAPVKSQAKN